MEQFIGLRWSFGFMSFIILFAWTEIETQNPKALTSKILMENFQNSSICFHWFSSVFMK